MNLPENVQRGTCTMRALVVALELVDPIFSGNGVYGRTVVRSLLRSMPELEVLVACGVPDGTCDVSFSLESTLGAHADAAWATRLRVVAAVPLPTWRRLDRACAWRAFARGVRAARERIAALSPDLVIAIDWHGAAAAAALAPRPPVAYFNFRVYSANSGADIVAKDAAAAGDDQDEDEGEEDGAFYARREREALALASSALALCENDAAMLRRLAPAGVAPPLEVLNPPLREDMRRIAAVGADAPAAAGGERERRAFVTCVSRLSREKNVSVFVAACERLGAAGWFAQHGLAPRLVGAAADGAYARELRARVLAIPTRAGGPAARVDDFGDAAFLAAAFRATRLLAHPATYEAYGMAIVEAAAFGAPAIVDAGGAIGALDRLRPGGGEARGEVLTADMSDATGASLASALRAALDEPNEPEAAAGLAGVSARARSRALGWGEADLGVALRRVVERTASAAPAPRPPVGLAALPDGLVLRAFLRAPFVTHGSLHAVCHRFKSLLQSDAFRELRLKSGLAEHVVIAACGWTADGDVLWNGRFQPIAKIPPMGCPRIHACSVIIDNEMWVMGGMNANKHVMATVQVYDPKTNSWRGVRPMRENRSHAVAGIVGGRLVVAGGFASVTVAAARGPVCERLASVEAYTGTEWVPLPSMPYAVAQATACVLNGRFYVMGGSGGDGGEDLPSSKLQVLEMTENGFEWTVKAEMPAGRISAACIVHEGKILLLGGMKILEGRNGFGSVRTLPEVTALMYSAEGDAWEIPEARWRQVVSDMGGGPCTAVAIDGGILLISTYDTIDAVYAVVYPNAPASVKAFEYRNAEWSEVGFAAGGELPRRAYIVGLGVVALPQAYGCLTLG